MRSSSDVGLRTAYDLLSFVGSTESLKIRDELPSDLFPVPSWLARHRADPCSSGLAWRREDCETCTARADVPPHHIARQLSHFTQDPDFVVPPLAEQRVGELVATLDASKVVLTTGVTEHDHQIDLVEPVLCRLAPRRLADLIRTVVSEADQRQGLQLRQLVVTFLRQNLLILEPRHWHQLEQIWSRLMVRIGVDLPTEEGRAEQFLFAFLLMHWDGDTQLERLLSRTLGATDLLECQVKFRPPKKHADSLAERLSMLRDDTSRRRLLWFVTANIDVVNDEFLEQTIALLKGRDFFVRGLALEVILCSERTAFIERVAQGAWAWEAANHPDENHWGSLLLATHGSGLSYKDLRARVWPPYLGLAVETRGSLSAEVKQYGQDLDRIWQRLPIHAPSLPFDLPCLELHLPTTGRGRPTMGPADSEYSRSNAYISRNATWGGSIEPNWLQEMQDQTGNFSEEYFRKQHETLGRALREQWEAGNVWFGHHCAPAGFDAVIRQCDGLADRWIEATEAGGPDNDSRLRRAQAFYFALCEAALKAKPELGVRLFDMLRRSSLVIPTVLKHTGLDVLARSLFSAPSSSTVERARRNCLEECTTDDELFRLVLAATAASADDSVSVMIDRGLSSPVDTDRARAMMLIGLADSPDAEDRLDSVSESQGWLGTTVQHAATLARRNRWAKHWYQRFLEADTDERGWGDFGVFLRCVDSRFWLWRDSADRSVSTPGVSRRLEFAQTNLSTIERAVKDNEKNLTDSYLGQKVLKNQAWPWMRSRERV